MSETVTLRLDPETRKILEDLVRREKRTRSEVIRDALRARANSAHEDESDSVARAERRPTAWEVYSKLNIPQGRPYRDTARNISKLLKEKLIAKRREGTL